MKKILVIFMVAMVVLLEVSLVFAQESKTDKVSGSIDIRNDFIYPEKGESQVGQSVNAFWQYKQISGFLETDFRDNSHTLTIKPSLLFNKGSWYLLGGMAANNQGSDFVQAGIWYVGNLGRFKVLLDARNYFSISSKNNGYTDNLLRVMYPITEKLFIGTELAFDHWWSDSHNWYFIGPRISYQLTEKISAYIRVSHEWNALNTGAETADRIRLGLAITF